MLKIHLRDVYEIYDSHNNSVLLFFRCYILTKNSRNCITLSSS